MNRSSSYPHGGGKSSAVRKLLSLPGIRQAIQLVKEHAESLAIDDALDVVSQGEFGDHLRELMSKGSRGATDRVLSDQAVACFIADSEDQWLEDLALEAGPKIAELWELSELAGRRLVDLIYWGTDSSWFTDEYYWLPLVLVMQERDAEQGCMLASRQRELERESIVIMPPEYARAGHLYLDVTYLPREGLLAAYRAVLLCRKQLQIQPQDLREGAPSSVEGDRALRAAALQRTKGSKNAARELGFRIYKSDNPAGSYPLFRKYAKLGRVLEHRLDALDAFLDSLSDKLRTK